MRLLKTIFVLLFSLMFAQLSWAAEPIKVAVIPSIVNMFIQYATLQGILKEDPQLFPEVMRKINETIQSQPGVVLSSKELGSDQDAASQFMLQIPYPADKEKYDADVIVLVGYSDDGKSVEVFFVGVESGRGASGFIDIQEINNETLSLLITEKLQEGLKKADKLLGVNADGIIDPYGSIIQYVLPAVTGEDVLLRVYYNEAHESIDQVEFLMKDQVQEGEYVFALAAKDQHKIIVKYEYKDFEIKNVTLDVDYKPGLDEMDTDKTFSVLSWAGYDVDFHFFWQAGQIVSVSVAPPINPYYPHLLENF